MKTSYNESFIHWDEAAYFMEQRLSRHSKMFIHEAHMKYINGQWNVGLLFDEAQYELNLDEVIDDG